MEYIIKRFRWNTPIWYLMDLFNGSLIFCVKTYRNWSLTDFDQGSPSHSINSALSNLYSSIKKFRCLSRHSGEKNWSLGHFKCQQSVTYLWWAKKLEISTFYRLILSCTYYNAMLSQILTHVWLKPSRFSHINHKLLCELFINSIGKSFDFFSTLIVYNFYRLKLYPLKR